MVIFEMFSNVLEYGILKMDLLIKYLIEGFVYYYVEWELCLVVFEYGFININIIVLFIDNFIKVLVKDSGEGFEY